MGWSDEAEQGFPPQRHREPAALRREILDELADHLALAAERESESGAGDDRQIRARVLKKFGNPAAIARALWWGAMKETVMKDWIQISINAVICISVVGFMALFYRQMQTTNTALINALNDRPSAAAETLPSVEFILHRASIDGPLAEGLRVRVLGRAFNEEPNYISEDSDSQGRVKFGPIRAGQYEVQFFDEKTGLNLRREITLYSGDGTKTIHVPIPPTTQVSLDITAPPTQHVGDTDLRFLMSMTPRWSYEDDYWKGEKRNVIVTSDGTFSVRSKSVAIPMSKSVRRSRGRQQINQPTERLTQTYGNRLSFADMGIVQLYEPQEDGDEWFGSLNDGYPSTYEYVPFSHDLQSNGPNSIVLDLPGALLDSYEYHLRLSANSNHGLPERFSWFPGPVSEKFADFVIDEARFVQYSVFFEWSTEQGQYNAGGGANESVTGKSGLLFALANAPKSLPEGYKLFLGFCITTMNLWDLGLVDVNLCAYLDTAPMPIHSDRASHPSRLQLASDPIWKLNANSIDANESKFYFVDLTDEVKNSNSFGNASGILFKWDIQSRNSVRIVPPETGGSRDKRQPVWLIMKPIANDVASNANANY